MFLQLSLLEPRLKAGQHERGAGIWDSLKSVLVQTVWLIFPGPAVHLVNVIIERSSITKIQGSVREERTLRHLDCSIVRFSPPWFSKKGSPSSSASFSDASGILLVFETKCIPRYSSKEFHTLNLTPFTQVLDCDYTQHRL